MPIWVCDRCRRQFARVNQSHECAPAMSLDDYFASGPEIERPIFDAVMARVAPFGPIHVEPVSVGIFLKKAKTFAELRPSRDRRRRDRVVLSFGLAHDIAHPRIARRTRWGPNTWFHVDLYGPDDVDDDVEAWLAEAYDRSPA